MLRCLRVMLLLDTIGKVSLAKDSRTVIMEVDSR